VSVCHAHACCPALPRLAISFSMYGGIMQWIGQTSEEDLAVLPPALAIVEFLPLSVIARPRRVGDEAI
jgi:hypothetical protein